MRIAILCLAAGFVSCASFAQEFCDLFKRPPDLEAMNAFEDIRKAVHFREGVYFLYASSDQKVKQKSGAASSECPSSNGMERWIVYDPDLINGTLALHFALAHELAHHLNNDSMSGQPRSKQQELDADQFAAEILASPPLNWTTEKLIQALNTLPLGDKATDLYPSIEERRAQLIAGYKKANGLVPPHPEPAPVKATWTLLPGSPANVRSFVAVEGGLLAGTYGNGVFRLQDADRAKWTSVNVGLTNLKVLTMSIFQGQVFVGTDAYPDATGVFSSSDSGSTWRASGLKGFIVQALHVFADKLFAGTYGSLWVSEDGKAWTFSNRGLLDRGIYINALTSTGHSLVAGLGSGLFRTDETAASWTKTPEIGQQTDVHALTAVGKSMYAGIVDRGVLISDDDGANWRECRAGMPALATVQSFAVAQGRIYAGTLGHGVFTTQSGSCAWQNVGLPDTDVWGLVIYRSYLLAGTPDGVSRIRVE